ncbi:unnamed protein product, partial [marine sediment metagenome]
TIDGTTTFCDCLECSKLRKGKKLYDMYKIAGLHNHGSLLPVEVCKIIENPKKYKLIEN